MIVSQAQCAQIHGFYYGDGSSCSSPPAGVQPCNNPESCQCQSACYSRSPAYSDQAFAGFTGEVAFATQYSPQGSTQPVVLAIDVKNRAIAPLKKSVTVTAGNTTSVDFQLETAVVKLQDVVTTATGEPRGGGGGSARP